MNQTLTLEPSLSPADDIDVQVLYRPLAGAVLPGLPTLDPTSEEYLFWKEQVRRCLKGWVAPDGKFINGIQYFGCNLVRMDYFDEELLRKIEKEPLLYRDNDNEITDIAWANLPRRLPNGQFKKAGDHIEIKARRKGFTFWDIVIHMYFFVFYPDYPIGSGYPSSKTKNIAEEREMFTNIWENLPELFKRWKGNELKVLTNNLNQAMATFEVGYSRNKTDKVHNYWHQATVSDPLKAGVFKGASYRRMSAVEAGEWPEDTLKNFIAFNYDSTAFGGFKIGSFNIGGTSTNITADWTDYQEIYYDVDSYDFSRHMTPAYMVAQGFFNRKTGKSDKEGALAHYQERRNKLVKNPDRLKKEMAENPIEESDFFMSTSNTTYDTNLINEHLQWCKLNMTDALWVRGKINPTYDIAGNEMGLCFVEDKDGEWVVNKEYGMPNLDYENLYYATIDDKFKSQDIKTYSKSKSSQSCMLIMLSQHTFPFPSDRPCAFYLSPSFDLDNTYLEFEKGQRFWGIDKTTYELSSEGYISFLRGKDKLHYLQYYEDRPGFNLTGRGKARNEVTLLGNQHFREGLYKNIDNSFILESYKKWNDKKNTDIGSCLHLAFKHREVTKHLNVVQKRQTGPKNDYASDTRFVVLASPNTPITHRRVQLGPKSRAAVRPR